MTHINKKVCVGCAHFRQGRCWVNPIQRKGFAPGCSHYLSRQEKLGG